ncbi:MAG: SpoIIE family protein phosphatase [Proteobacteria bacterium]|nr:SpoIIE family protein phosphatase [Pseudomonadota bacterium]
MKNLLILFFLFVSLVASPLSASEAIVPKTKKHVLLLNSYSKGYAWTDNVVRGVEDVLLKGEDIILKVEYMDTKVSNTDLYYLLLNELYATKYSGRKPDVIISSDDDALKFLQTYREDLFPGVPVVFCGVNNFTPAKLEGFSRYTGVNEAADFNTNLSLLLTLHPKTTKMYVINDQMTTAGFLKKEFADAARDYEGRLQFEYLDNISMADLISKLSVLPGDSLVFYLSFFKDNTGKTYTPEEAIPLISRSSSVPVYGAVDYMLGLGIVGGMLKSSYFQGETAANLAMKILGGQDVTSIPVVLKSPNQYMFDYQQLTARQVNQKLLPPKSLIINEPETFYYRYKRLIWATTGVFLGLLGFIIVLLFNIKKRIRAQKGLQTIISATASILDYQSLDSFRKQLTQQLGQLLPIRKRLLFFNHKPLEPPSGKVVFPEPVSKSDETAMNEMPEKAAKLILDALTEEKCFVSRKNGVAFFKSRHLPGNMIYLQGERGMDDLDRDLLEIFANNVTMSIENIEKHKIEKSLETAKQIQMSMLPRFFEEFSEKHGVDLHAFLSPAKEIGGDLYDFFAVDKEHLCFVVGDVSGKGVPAALFMAMAKSLIRSAAEDNIRPDQIISKANNALCRDNEQSMFVTVFLAIYNTQTRVLSYTSAGHNPPYVVAADGSVRQINPIPGFVLGGFEGGLYRVEQTTLNGGDGLYVYSDGVTEAMNKDNEEYGENRLKEVLEANAVATARHLNDQVIKDLQGFVDGAAQSDDITMLFVRV